jgi:hypothetical protein
MRRVNQVIMGLVFLSLGATGLAHAEEASKPALKAPEMWFVYAVIIVVFLVGLVALAYIRSAIAESEFKLSDALSEEADITMMEDKGGGKFGPVLGATGEPVKITTLVGSVSRVIALMGMVSIVMLFLGFGIFVMFYFAIDEGAPKDIDKIIQFLVAGLTLFAPYIVNKFSSLFDISSTKRGS